MTQDEFNTLKTRMVNAEVLVEEMGACDKLLEVLESTEFKINIGISNKRIHVTTDAHFHNLENWNVRDISDISRGAIIDSLRTRKKEIEEAFLKI